MESFFGPPVYTGRSQVCVLCNAALSEEDIRMAYDLCPPCAEEPIEAPKGGGQ